MGLTKKFEKQREENQSAQKSRDNAVAAILAALEPLSTQDRTKVIEQALSLLNEPNKITYLLDIRTPD